MGIKKMDSRHTVAVLRFQGKEAGILKGEISPDGKVLTVENEYAARISGGQVRGNGGGAPVVVNGWTCQGYDTPEVLRTGNASQCRSGGNAILAVLAVPDATKTAA
jgi:hypothetical protein